MWLKGEDINYLPKRVQTKVVQEEIEFKYQSGHKGFLTASLRSPSLGDRVTDKSKVPRLCSGYWGSFKSSVTSSVLDRRRISYFGQKNKNTAS